VGIWPKSCENGRTETSCICGGLGAFCDCGLFGGIGLAQVRQRLSWYRPLRYRLARFSLHASDGFRYASNGFGSDRLGAVTGTHSPHIYALCEGFVNSLSL
jgi:hypothetical protein